MKQQLQKKQGRPKKTQKQSISELLNPKKTLTNGKIHKYITSYKQKKQHRISRHYVKDVIDVKDSNDMKKVNTIQKGSGIFSDTWWYNRHKFSKGQYDDTAKMSMWVLAKLYIQMKIRVITEAEYRTFKASLKARVYFARMRYYSSFLLQQMANLTDGEDSLIRKARSMIDEIFIIQNKVNAGYIQKHGKAKAIKPNKMKLYRSRQDKLRTELMNFCCFNKSSDLTHNRCDDSIKQYFGLFANKRAFVCSIAKYRHYEALFNKYYNKFEKQFENFMAYYPSCEGVVKNIKILRLDILNRDPETSFDMSKCPISEIDVANRKIFGKAIDENDFLPDDFREKTVGKSEKLSDEFKERSQNFKSLVDSFVKYLKTMKEKFEWMEYYGIHRYWGLLPKSKTFFGTTKKGVKLIGDLVELTNDPKFREQYLDVIRSLAAEAQPIFNPEDTQVGRILPNIYLKNRLFAGDRFTTAQAARAAGAANIGFHAAAGGAVAYLNIQECFVPCTFNISGNEQFNYSISKYLTIDNSTLDAYKLPIVIFIQEGTKSMIDVHSSFSLSFLEGKYIPVCYSQYQQDKFTIIFISKDCIETNLLNIDTFIPVNQTPYFLLDDLPDEMPKLTHEKSFNIANIIFTKYDWGRQHYNCAGVAHAPICNIISARGTADAFITTAMATPNDANITAAHDAIETEAGNVAVADAVLADKLRSLTDITMVENYESHYMSVVNLQLVGNSESELQYIREMNTFSKQMKAPTVADVNRIARVVGLREIQIQTILNAINTFTTNDTVADNKNMIIGGDFGGFSVNQNAITGYNGGGGGAALQTMRIIAQQYVKTLYPKKHYANDEIMMFFNNGFDLLTNIANYIQYDNNNNNIPYSNKNTKLITDFIYSIQGLRQRIQNTPLQIDHTNVNHTNKYYAKKQHMIITGFGITLQTNNLGNGQPPNVYARERITDPNVKAHEKITLYTEQQLRNIIIVLDRLMSNYSYGAKPYVKRDFACLDMDDGPYGIRKLESPDEKKHFYTLAFPNFIETYLFQLSSGFNKTRATGYYSEQQIALINKNINFDIVKMFKDKNMDPDIPIRILLIPSKYIKEIADIDYGKDYEHWFMKHGKTIGNKITNIINKLRGQAAVAGRTAIRDAEAAREAEEAKRHISASDFDLLTKKFCLNFYRDKARPDLEKYLSDILNTLKTDNIITKLLEVKDNKLTGLLDEGTHGNGANIINLFKYIFTNIRLKFIDVQIQKYHEEVAKKEEPIVKLDKIASEVKKYRTLFTGTFSNLLQTQLLFGSGITSLLYTQQYTNVVAQLYNDTPPSTIMLTNILYGNSNSTPAIVGMLQQFNDNQKLGLVPFEDKTGNLGLRYFETYLYSQINQAVKYITFVLRDKTITQESTKFFNDMKTATELNAHIIKIRNSIQISQADKEAKDIYDNIKNKLIGIYTRFKTTYYSYFTAVITIYYHLYYYAFGLIYLYETGVKSAGDLKSIADKYKSQATEYYTNNIAPTVCKLSDNIKDIVDDITAISDYLTASANGTGAGTGVGVLSLKMMPSFVKPTPLPDAVFNPIEITGLTRITHANETSCQIATYAMLYYITDIQNILQTSGYSSLPVLSAKVNMVGMYYYEFDKYYTDKRIGERGITGFCKNVCKLVNITCKLVYNVILRLQHNPVGGVPPTPIIHMTQYNTLFYRIFSTSIATAATNSEEYINIKLALKNTILLYVNTVAYFANYYAVGFARVNNPMTNGSDKFETYFQCIRYSAQLETIKTQRQYLKTDDTGLTEEYKSKYLVSHVEYGDVYEKYVEMVDSNRAFQALNKLKIASELLADLKETTGLEQHMISNKVLKEGADSFKPPPAPAPQHPDTNESGFRFYLGENVNVGPAQEIIQRIENVMMKPALGGANGIYENMFTEAVDLVELAYSNRGTNGASGVVIGTMAVPAANFDISSLITGNYKAQAVNTVTQLLAPVLVSQNQIVVGGAIATGAFLGAGAAAVAAQLLPLIAAGPPVQALHAYNEFRTALIADINAGNGHANTLGNIIADQDNVLKSTAGFKLRDFQCVDLFVTPTSAQLSALLNSCLHIKTVITTVVTCVPNAFIPIVNRNENTLKYIFILVLLFFQINTGAPQELEWAKKIALYLYFQTMEGITGALPIALGGRINDAAPANVYHNPERLLSIQTMVKNVAVAGGATATVDQLAKEIIAFYNNTTYTTEHERAVEIHQQATINYCISLAQYQSTRLFLEIKTSVDDLAGHQNYQGCIETLTDIAEGLDTRIDTTFKDNIDNIVKIVRNYQIIKNAVEYMRYLITRHNTAVPDNHFEPSILVQYLADLKIADRIIELNTAVQALHAVGIYGAKMDANVNRYNAYQNTRIINNVNGNGVAQAATPDALQAAFAVNVGGGNAILAAPSIAIGGVNDANKGNVIQNIFDLVADNANNSLKRIIEAILEITNNANPINAGNQVESIFEEIINQRYDNGRITGANPDHNNNYFQHQIIKTLQQCINFTFAVGFGIKPDNTVGAVDKEVNFRKLLKNVILHYTNNLKFQLLAEFNDMWVGNTIPNTVANLTAEIGVNHICHFDDAVAANDMPTKFKNVLSYSFTLLSNFGFREPPPPQGLPPPPPPPPPVAPTPVYYFIIQNEIALQPLNGNQFNLYDYINANNTGINTLPAPYNNYITHLQAQDADFVNTNYPSNHINNLKTVGKLLERLYQDCQNFLSKTNTHMANVMNILAIAPEFDNTSFLITSHDKITKLQGIFKGFIYLTDTNKRLIKRKIDTDLGLSNVTVIDAANLNTFYASSYTQLQTYINTHFIANPHNTEIDNIISIIDTEVNRVKTFELNELKEIYDVLVGKMFKINYNLYKTYELVHANAIAVGTAINYITAINGTLPFFLNIEDMKRFSIRYMLELFKYFNNKINLDNNYNFVYTRIDKLFNDFMDNTHLTTAAVGGGIAPVPANNAGLIIHNLGIPNNKLNDLLWNFQNFIDPLVPVAIGENINTIIKPSDLGRFITINEFASLDYTPHDNIAVANYQFASTDKSTYFIEFRFQSTNSVVGHTGNKTFIDRLQELYTIAPYIHNPIIYLNGNKCIIDAVILSDVVNDQINKPSLLTKVNTIYTALNTQMQNLLTAANSINVSIAAIGAAIGANLAGGYLPIKKSIKSKRSPKTKKFIQIKKSKKASTSSHSSPHSILNDKTLQPMRKYTVYSKQYNTPKKHKTPKQPIPNKQYKQRKKTYKANSIRHPLS